MRGERGVRRSMYSSALAAGLCGEEAGVVEDMVSESNPSPINSGLAVEDAFRCEGGGVIGATAPALLCILLLRPPEMGSSLNGSQSEVWAGVARIELVEGVSLSLLKRLIDEGEGEEARKRR